MFVILYSIYFPLVHNFCFCVCPLFFISSVFQMGQASSSSIDKSLFKNPVFLSRDIMVLWQRIFAPFSGFSENRYRLTRVSLSLFLWCFGCSPSSVSCVQLCRSSLFEILGEFVRHVADDTEKYLKYSKQHSHLGSMSCGFHSCMCARQRAREEWSWDFVPSFSHLDSLFLVLLFDLPQ